MKILGIQHYAFDSKTDGKRIEGNKLHCLVSNPEIQMVGQQVELISCNDAILNETLEGQPLDSLLGKSIQVVYNRYGKPAHINVVK